MQAQSSVFAPLVDHPHLGAWFTIDWDGHRADVLLRHVRQLQDELGPDHPQVHLARSWHAVAHGAESFNETLLQRLRDSEPLIRKHYPDAMRALAMNLACQGFHTWFLHSMDEAVAPLLEAYQLMLTHGLAIEADVVKVAEVLADCLASVEAYDDALTVLFSAQPYLLAAIEQNEFAVAQYEEFREEFLEDYVDEFLPENEFMVRTLRGPRLGRDLKC